MKYPRLQVLLNLAFWFVFFFTVNCFYWAAIYWTSVKSYPLLWTFVLALDMWIFFVVGCWALAFIQLVKADPAFFVAKVKRLAWLRRLRRRRKTNAPRAPKAPKKDVQKDPIPLL